MIFNVYMVLYLIQYLIEKNKSNRFNNSYYLFKNNYDDFVSIKLKIYILRYKSYYIVKVIKYISDSLSYSLTL